MAKFLPLRLGFIKIGFAVAVHWFCLGACVCRGFCCPVAFLSLFFGLDSAIDHRELALQWHCGVSERRRSRGFIGNGHDLKKKTFLCQINTAGNRSATRTQCLQFRTRPIISVRNCIIILLSSCIIILQVTKASKAMGDAMQTSQLRVNCGVVLAMKSQRQRL